MYFREYVKSILIPYPNKLYRNIKFLYGFKKTRDFHVTFFQSIQEIATFVTILLNGYPYGMRTSWIQQIFRCAILDYNLVQNLKWILKIIFTRLLQYIWPIHLVIFMHSLILTTVCMLSSQTNLVYQVISNTF